MSLKLFLASKISYPLDLVFIPPSSWIFIEFLIHIESVECAWKLIWFQSGARKRWNLFLLHTILVLYSRWTTHVSYTKDTNAAEWEGKRVTFVKLLQVKSKKKKWILLYDEWEVSLISSRLFSCCRRPSRPPLDVAASACLVYVPYMIKKK